jgi:hypothetical protein
MRIVYGDKLGLYYEENNVNLKSIWTGIAINTYGLNGVRKSTQGNYAMFRRLKRLRM